MDSKGDFLAGVIIGGVIGALVGIMFAPASGKETRAQLVEKGTEFKDLAMGRVSASKDLLNRLRERLPKIKEVQDVLDAAEREISEA